MLPHDGQGALPLDVSHRSHPRRGIPVGLFFTLPPQLCRLSHCCAGCGSQNARHFLLNQKRMLFPSPCSPFPFHSSALDSVPHMSFQAPVGLLLSARSLPSVSMVHSYVMG